MKLVKRIDMAPVAGPSLASVKQVGQHLCLIDLEFGVYVYYMCRFLG